MYNQQAKDIVHQPVMDCMYVGHLLDFGSSEVISDGNSRGGSSTAWTQHYISEPLTQPLAQQLPEHLQVAP